MNSHFFAYLSRMKLIKRWSLMRNTVPENIQEHSLDVAVIAHALALIDNRYYGGSNDAERIALLAIYHDVGEVIIGDLPTPVKYFNPEIQNTYAAIETVAKEKLLSYLPAELREDYRALFFPPQGKERQLIKAADKISAYLKCLEENMAGNKEFIKAEQSLKKELEKYREIPTVNFFLENFSGSYRLTLDEME